MATVFLILATMLAVSTNYCEAECGGQIPAKPQPGEYKAVSIPVNDPNLGVVQRTFGIFIPTDYDTNTKLPLLMFFHGSGGKGSNGCKRGWCRISEGDPDGSFIVVQADGMGGTWNSSTPDGPFGPPCKLPRTLDFDSSQCNLLENDIYGCNIYFGENASCQDIQDIYTNTCLQRSCYDDIAFVRAIVNYVDNQYCLDADSVHMSGSSNGGMLAWTSINKLNDIVASFGIVAASPVLGFPDEVPLDPPVSIIDLHGLQDKTFPYGLGYAGSEETGPKNSVLTPWGFYVLQKKQIFRAFKRKMGCSAPQVYPTDRDDARNWDGWGCKVLSNCRGGNEFVSCTGNYEHGPPYRGIARDSDYHNKIIWDFMKRHARGGDKRRK